jgi:hypothetical protein
MAPFPFARLLLRDHWSHHHPQVLLHREIWVGKPANMATGCVSRTTGKRSTVWVFQHPQKNGSLPKIGGVSTLHSSQPRISPGTAASPSSSTSYGHGLPRRSPVPPATGCSSQQVEAPTQSTSPAHWISPVPWPWLQLDIQQINFLVDY